MKKVLSRAVLCALLTLAVFFTACKSPSSGGGGGNSGGESAYNPPEKNIPLTLEAIADGQITFDNLDRITNLKYRINDGDVTAATDTGISLSAGDKISLFAEGTSNGNITNQCFRIICSSYCYVYGNVMSLLTEDYQTATEITQNYAFACLFYDNSHIKNHPSKNIVLPATTLANYCYYEMFYGCNSLTQAPVLPATTLANSCYSYMFYCCTSLTQTPALPATTLAKNCYFDMFSGCTSLTQAPALPATTLAQSCYYQIFDGCTSLTQAPVLPATTLAKDCYGDMFSGCTSLTQAPVLPATTLANSCYYEMFYGCTSLTQAPVLPATTLTGYCYAGMFYGCTSLNKVTCLATDLSAARCTDSWLSGVASSGTFTKASGADWSVKTGYDGIPSGWTTFDYDKASTPLTLEAIAAGEITFDNLDRITNLKYIKNNGPLTNATSSISVAAGDVVSIFAQGTSNTSDYSTTFRINCSSDCYVYGNVMSLLTDDYQTATTISQNYAFAYLFYDNAPIKNHPEKEIVLPATTLAESCYSSMFEGCSSLTQAPALPATTLAKDCYSYMFYCCTSLTQAPALPATTLANYCYYEMFSGCTSLTQTPELPATTLAEGCYHSMFSGCTSLTQAPALPATTLAGDCYYGMFSVCTSLTQAPELPATTLADYCYYGMFDGCTSLTQAPALPATALAVGCYSSMFSRCTSLTQAPALPATTLAEYCYDSMFYGCTSLNKVTCLATDLSDAGCTDCWLYGVASSGTFTKASGADWSSGTSGIPDGWNISFSDSQNIPLTLEAIAAGEITFDNLDRITNLKYIKNNGPLTNATSSISVAAGDVINLFAHGTNNGSSVFFKIICSSDCYVYGNVMSLLTDDYQTATTITQEYAFNGLFKENIHIINHSEKKLMLPATSLADSCYMSMFNGCSSLTTAPDLPATNLRYSCYEFMFYNCSSLTKAPDLPATNLRDSCYYEMFYNCSSLTKAPDLPATNLRDSCYQGMFHSCSSLTKAPDLPATDLAQNCYNSMFGDCTSLTETPVLPATTLKFGCYDSMFFDCSSLNKVTCLATDLSAADCTTNWLSGVASSGTFTKASGADWSSGTSGIPAGWTVQNK